MFYSLFVTFALVLLLAGIGGAYGYYIFNGPGPLKTPKITTLEKGLTVTEIAAKLEAEGIISNAQLFNVASGLNGARARFNKPGEYEFKPDTSMREVINIIAAGRTLVYKIVVPEGWTTQMALERLRTNEVLDGEITLNPPEGSIMPATYDVRRGEQRDKVIAKMIAAQQKLMDELWAKRAPDSPVKTREEAVILASIVEKETGKADERPRVAAVFGNRLKKNMRLQSDPTIIYGIAGGKGRLDRRLTKADIAETTPYNTYRIAGLPQGPIANPGRAALEAVLNPIESNDLYFVADGTGGHAFAASLEEHNANVKKWRDVENNRGKVSEAEEEAVAKPAAEAPAAEAPVAVPAEQPALAAEAKVTQDQAAVAAPPVEPPLQLKTEAAPDALPAIEPPPEQQPKIEAAAEAKAEPVPVPKVEAEPLPVPKVEAEPEPKTIMPDPAADLVPANDVPAVKIDPAAEAEAKKAEPKPGSLVRIAKRTVPIPMPKPKNR